MNWEPENTLFAPLFTEIWIGGTSLTISRLRHYLTNWRKHGCVLLKILLTCVIKNQHFWKPSSHKLTSSTNNTKLTWNRKIKESYSLAYLNYTRRIAYKNFIIKTHHHCVFLQQWHDPQRICLATPNSLCNIFWNCSESFTVIHLNQRVIDRCTVVSSRVASHKATQDCIMWSVHPIPWLSILQELSYVHHIFLFWILLISFFYFASWEFKGSRQQQFFTATSGIQRTGTSLLWSIQKETSADSFHQF